MEDTVPKTGTQNVSEKLAALKQDVADIARVAKGRAINGTKEWATEHHTATIGIIAGVAAGIGFAIGLLVGRSRS